MRKTLMIVAGLLVMGVACQSHAVTVVSYESGVAASAGAAGAADPLTQGWSFNNGGVSNQFAAAYDSGNGGWRTVDGTTTAPAFESQPIGASSVSQLAGGSWRMDWTFALDSDAIGSAGTVVNNYYVPRSDDNVAVWLETTAFFYQLQFVVSTGTDTNLFVRNGNQALVQLTNDGSGFDTFHRLNLVSEDGGATAKLSIDGNLATTLTSVGSGGSNRVVFGTSSSSGQGSAVWNHLRLEVIPEPATVGMVVGSMGMLLVRRRCAGRAA